MRISAPALKVLRAFLESSDPLSGADLYRITRVGPGTVYPMLERFERAGWATFEWEQVDPREIGRPRKRLYRLTGKGAAEGRSALSDVSFAGGGLGWAT